MGAPGLDFETWESTNLKRCILSAPESKAPLSSLDRRTPCRVSGGWPHRRCRKRGLLHAMPHQPRTYANTSGATIDASLSMMNFGVVSPSLPHVIFSFGTAPEYDP